MLIILDEQQTDTLEQGLKKQENIRIVRDDLKEIGVFTYKNYETKALHNNKKLFTRFFFTFNTYYLEKIKGRTTKK